LFNCAVKVPPTAANTTRTDGADVVVVGLVVTVVEVSPPQATSVSIITHPRMTRMTPPTLIEPPTMARRRQIEELPTVPAPNDGVTGAYTKQNSPRPISSVHD
jgi:hypothetical protein